MKTERNAWGIPHAPVCWCTFRYVVGNLLIICMNIWDFLNFLLLLSLLYIAYTQVVFCLVYSENVCVFLRHLCWRHWLGNAFQPWKTDRRNLCSLSPNVELWLARIVLFLMFLPAKLSPYSILIIFLIWCFN